MWYQERKRYPVAMVFVGGLFLLSLLFSGCPNPADDDDASASATPIPTPASDRDEDGYADDDCDDGNAAIHPGAEEICDGIDNDCDGAVDADDPDLTGAETWYPDVDSDGYGDPNVPLLDCNQPEGAVTNADDCDDGNPAINPDATEDCDGLDNNCNGEVDEGSPSTTYYRDADQDGYGGSESQEACAPPEGYVETGGDCDDTREDINPDADEVCDTSGSSPDTSEGLDNDCDGLIDEADPDLKGAPLWYQDGDGDSYGSAETSGADDQVYACSAPTGFVADNTDCDDADPDLNPLTLWYIDADQDGFGSDAQTLTQCQTPDGYVRNADDCNDADAAYHPGASEEDCSDPNDYNCDGSSAYEDKDGDGFPACGTEGAADCDDADVSIYPGALEVCDHADNNCDGEVDEAVLTTWYLDADKDGYGAEDSAVARCEAPSSSYIATAGDCNDLQPTVHPGADEICDGLDNDCDELADDEDPDVTGTSVWYADSDDDGYGVSESSVQACDPPDGFADNAGDCDDENSSVHPGAPEVCDPDAPDGGLDNDCNGLADDLDPGLTNPNTWYIDQDGDGYGETSSSLLQCAQPEGYADNADDCDDVDPEVHPGALEVCDGINVEDAVDNDCNGLADDRDPDLSEPSIWYLDNDGDGFGTSRITLTQCVQPDWYVDNPDDCDDSDMSINPDADEVCNGKDDDCDNGQPEGGIDEDAIDADTWYIDQDGDGFGAATQAQDACTQPDGFVDNTDDCDDAAEGSYPGAQEVCDGEDNNCDGQVDDGIPGSDVTCAGLDCEAIVEENPDSPSGLYWIQPSGAGEPYQVYCEMETDGGGWTLVLQTSSASEYNFEHPIWTSSEPPSEVRPDPSQDQDAVSPAFYHLEGIDSMLCMGDLEHCAAWRHEAGTARDLVTGPRIATEQGAAQDCTTLHCGPNTYPASLRAVTPGSDAWTYHRFGYVNDDNPWGLNIRVGFSGDGDSSDSSDTAIGLGLECTNTCLTGSTTGDPHGYGSGYYAYNGWATAPLDGPLPGFLFIRNYTDEYCGDGIDNDGDGLVDEGDLGLEPACPAPDCYAIKRHDSSAGDGLYWLDPNNSGAPFETYCDMSTDGGGWTMVLQTSSTSAYGYDHKMWMALSFPGPTENPDPVVDQDAASHAFYTLDAVESLICLGDLEHCAAWNHGQGTARDLSNGGRALANEEAAETCTDFKCGPNTLPDALNAATSGTNSDTFHRFGYVNDVNSWGTKTRVGFTGDGNSSDSSDTVIGMGLACSSNCSSSSTSDGAHGYGSGFYLFNDWAVPPYDGALPAFLLVRPRWTPEYESEEICDDGIDNDGDGEVDEGPIGGSPGCPAPDCLAILEDQSDAEDGQYWIDADNSGRPVLTYCDMTTDGGGWTLVLQTAGYSAYTYSHAVWSASSADASQVWTTDADVAQDAVSPGFYSLEPSASMLCMKDLDHCAAWTHEVAIPAELARGPRLPGSQYSASVCNSFYCGPNTLPAAIRDATSGTTSGAWHRWGYVNDVNSWGTSTRIGFTGDNDSSDSSDTVIGLGLSCYGSCTSNSTTDGAHGGGSGFYEYYGWSTAPHDGPLDGYLFVR